MRNALLLLGLLGTVLFGGGFVLSFASPLTVERLAQEIVRLEVERRVGERIDDLARGPVAGVARRALERTDADIAAVERSLREDLPRRVAHTVADMLKADCECRRRLADAATRAANERLVSLRQVRDRLGQLIEGAYASVTQQLMREFRIVTASNAVAFALLWAVTLRRRRATLQLLLPAVVLVGAVVITSGLYLFNQNWLHTIVYGSYVGLAHAAWLAVVALLLADIVFNRARVTTRLLDLALQLVGVAVKVVPC